MSELERQLRERVAETRAIAESAIDVETDLAATLRRQPSLETSSPAAEAAEGRRAFWMAAAAVIAVVVAGVVVVTRFDRGDDVVRTMPEPPATVPVAASSVPTTTTDVATTVATTVAPAVVPVTTQPPLDQPPPDPGSPLEDWPAVPDPGVVDDVALLFPSEPVPGAGAPYATEIDGRGGLANYIQTWLDVDAGVSLIVRTRLDRTDGTPDELRRTTSIAGWDDAYFTGDGSDPVILTLGASEGYVSLHAQGLDQSEVAAIAESLTRRPGDEPGWDIDVPGRNLGDIAQGWGESSGSRILTWAGADGAVAEMFVARSNPDLVSFATGNADLSATTIGGADAIVATTGSRVSVIWAPDETTSVVFGMYGTVEDALAIARSVTVLDRADYDAAASGESIADDGCQSLYC